MNLGKALFVGELVTNRYNTLIVIHQNGMTLNNKLFRLKSFNHSAVSIFPPITFGYIGKIFMTMIFSFFKKGGNPKI